MMVCPKATAFFFLVFFIFLGAGYMVLIPDYFRGGSQHPREPGVPEFLRQHTQWENLRRDFQDKIKPYALKHGAKTFASVGELQISRKNALILLPEGNEYKILL